MPTYGCYLVGIKFMLRPVLSVLGLHSLLKYFYLEYLGGFFFLTFIKVYGYTAMWVATF